MKLAIALALCAAALLLASPARSDGPPPSLTPVLIPPIACGIPGYPPCEVYRHHVYLPVIERAQ